MKIIARIGAAIIFAAALSAQAVIVAGTGDPDIDTPAVQAAVNQGGRVVLMGHFSFDRPPTAPAGAIYNRMVTISNSVVISGTPDDEGEMPTIAGGNWPFFIDAFGSHVTIQRLHFIRPKAGAIWVYAVSGLTISNCRIEGVEATAEFGTQANVSGPLSGGIGVYGDPAPPGMARPGHPKNFSGTLKIVNNDIDMGARTGATSLGIVIFGAGKSPGQEVDIYVTGNNIRNVTEPAINLRIIGGRAHVERNTVTTGALSSGSPDAIRIVGAGSFLIAHNSIDCSWTDPAATGINAFSQAAPNPPEANAIIADNDINMSAPEGTAFGPNSAAIEIKGGSQGNLVANNRIRGHTTTGLTVIQFNAGVPGNTSFVANELDGFQSSLADVFIDVGPSNTIVIGHQANVEDHGSGTVVVPMRLNPTMH
jgi:hypothetical protein